MLRLTDDTVMLQHTTYAVTNPRHDYCTDDNARALIPTVGTAMRLLLQPWSTSHPGGPFAESILLALHMDAYLLALSVISLALFIPARLC